MKTNLSPQDLHNLSEWFELTARCIQNSNPVPLYKLSVRLSEEAKTKKIQQEDISAANIDLDEYATIKIGGTD